jgi:hypothetical protein
LFLTLQPSRITYSCQGNNGMPICLASSMTSLPLVWFVVCVVDILGVGDPIRFDCI